MLAQRDPAGQLPCLPDPTRHELLVELIAFAAVEGAGGPVSAGAGRGRSALPRHQLVDPDRRERRRATLRTRIATMFPLRLEINFEPYRIIIRHVKAS